MSAPDAPSRSVAGVPTHEKGPPHALRVALACGIGTMLETLDLYLYGLMAALVFNQLFFPSLSPAAGTIAAFGTLAAGFLARPLGSVVFGHLGDRIGRKPAFAASLILMGTATFLIAFLPTYAAIGAAAPILLTVLRVAQGFAYAGDFGGAAALALEHAPRGRRGLYGSFVTMGIPVGTAGASGTVLLLSSITTEEQFLSWGWRIPFVVSGLLAVLGFWVRRRIAESPVFQRKVVAEGTRARMPIVTLLRREWRAVLISMGLSTALGVNAYIGGTYFVSLGGQAADLGAGALSVAVLAGTLCTLVFAPAGALSDRFGRRRVFASGPLLAVVVAFPSLWLVTSGEVLLIGAGIFLLFGSYVLMALVQAAFFSELFSPEVRVSGTAFGYQVAVTVAGGSSPLIAASLVAATGGTWPIGLFVIAAAFVTLLCVAVAPETLRREETDNAPAGTDPDAALTRP